ncbi:nitroreductase family protein [Nocardioides sp. zg-1228]|uniref:nitroreductase family protein n=1 Tax=Nocardioides sp. zg-1228 TaxID=2763008 RepID=UPI0016427C1A|nr:nitroreductase family protein [Nocardioides sp. zg-1228]MBC2931819.1 nitroreductase family protein [Nocardioides sp. zg-1228]QSF57391.1 nitroreductase family protein [Nocardioides sp. zg-1228]
MEFRDVVRRRRMVRRYAERPVDPAAVERMLEHAQRAPNAGFTQGWAFLVLDTPEDVALFWAATGADPDDHNRWLDGMRTAPVVIVPLTSKSAYLDRYAQPDKGWTDRDEERWPVPYWWVDAGMASLLVLQTAVDEGLGACFFGIPGEHLASFRDAFGIPDDHAPVGAITVGHRADDDAGAPGSSARRERLGDLVHRGRWGTTVTP